MPAKADGDRRRPDPATPDPPPSDAPPAPRYRRPDPDAVRRAARRALARSGRSFSSQAALRRHLLKLLREEEPLFSLGGKRMRRLLVSEPGIHLKVRYAERPSRRPLSRCPVCGSSLAAIRNRTLLEDRVTLGYRCTKCGYWTHLKRRVPVRYEFVPAGIDGRPRGDTPRPD